MINIVRTKKDQRELDVWLLVSAFILTAIGLGAVYSASLTRSLAIYSDRYYIIRSQIFWIVIGSLSLGITINFDHRYYANFARYFLIFTVILMIFVFIPGLSHQVGKAKRWVKIGVMAFQPSELAKISLVMYLADLFSRKEDKINNFKYVFLPALVVTGSLIILTLLQSNLGTAVILFFIGLILFFAAGIPLKQMFFVFLSFLPVLVFAITRETYRIKRIFAYLNPWLYPDTLGYNIIQSWKAFYNGGLMGVGWGKSIQKVGLLPAPHTDFIMAILAEEIGLLGVLIVMILFIIILFRGCYISTHSHNLFSKLLALGLTFMIFLQAAVNMAVVTGLLPTTGLVLPFISYGGSSMLVNMSSIGILLNIHRSNVLIEGDKI